MTANIKFRKKVKLSDLLTLNISKSGCSLTLGKPGFSLNLAKNGTYLNLGLPGTGLYTRTKLENKDDRSEKPNE